MNCKNCGTLLQPDTFFCPNCGAQNYPMSEEATILLNTTQTTAVNAYNEPQTVITNPVQWTAPQPQQPPKKSNTGLIIAVIVMAIVIIAGIAAIIGYTVGNNDNVPAGQIAEDATQSVEITAQQQETTTETVTVAQIPETEQTTVSTTADRQAVPTFTYNDNTQSSQYLFDSANQYITRSYLSTCTRDEITIILNEMYARHGYIFKDAELREYFNSQSWYHGTTNSMDEAAAYFNTVESANLNTIYEYMKDMGWRE